jgi:hypothetical protein
MSYPSLLDDLLSFEDLAKAGSPVGCEQPGWSRSFGNLDLEPPFWNYTAKSKFLATSQGEVVYQLLQSPVVPQSLGGHLKAEDTPNPPAKGILPLCTSQLPNNLQGVECSNAVLEQSERVIISRGPLTFMVHYSALDQELAVVT